MLSYKILPFPKTTNREVITMKKSIGSTLDFLWVLQAFLRGKVLRQKDYRPQGNVFCLSTQTNYKRITMLMKWWARRPATVAEVRELKTQKPPAYEPFFWFGPAPMRLQLYWNDGDWRWHYSCDWFDRNVLTIPPRKF